MAYVFLETCCNISFWIELLTLLVFDKQVEYQRRMTKRIWKIDEQRVTCKGLNKPWAEVTTDREQDCFLGNRRSKEETKLEIRTAYWSSKRNQKRNLETLPQYSRCLFGKIGLRCLSFFPPPVITSGLDSPGTLHGYPSNQRRIIHSPLHLLLSQIGKTKPSFTATSKRVLLPRTTHYTHYYTLHTTAVNFSVLATVWIRFVGRHLCLVKWDNKVSCDYEYNSYTQLSVR
jgi:hypothetical protein